MKIKITKLQTSQGIFEYYFTDLHPGYKVSGSTEIDTSIVEISDEMLKVLILLGNTQNSLAANIYYISNNTEKLDLIDDLTALSAGY